jgi:hypothetical protein
MNYFAIDYPNHTRLLVKSNGDVEDVLSCLTQFGGLLWGDRLYNPQSFLTLMQITNPTDAQKEIAQRLSHILIGVR